MTSERKIQANRINGAKSRGPTSPEGRRISSRNRTTFGLRSKSLFIAGENKDDYRHLYFKIRAEMNPVGSKQLACVRDMTIGQWMLRRADRAEAHLHSTKPALIDLISRNYPIEMFRRHWFYFWMHAAVRLRQIQAATTPESIRTQPEPPDADPSRDPQGANALTQPNAPVSIRTQSDQPDAAPESVRTQHEPATAAAVSIRTQISPHPPISYMIEFERAAEPCSHSTACKLQPEDGALKSTLDPPPSRAESYPVFVRRS
jgi:hypothetical protein